MGRGSWICMVHWLSIKTDLLVSYLLTYLLWSIRTKTLSHENGVNDLYGDFQVLEGKEVELIPVEES